MAKQLTAGNRPKQYSSAFNPVWDMIKAAGRFAVITQPPALAVNIPHGRLENGHWSKSLHVSAWRSPRAFAS